MLIDAALNTVEAVRPRPEIGSACTRTHGSGCDECVTACPMEIFSLTGESAAPEPDAGTCIACGICVGSCPADAIRGVGPVPSRIVEAARRRDGDLAVECSGVTREAQHPDAALRVTCLAGLSWETVTASATALPEGGTLELIHGDCAECPLGAGERVNELGEISAAYVQRISPGRRVVLRRESTRGSLDDDSRASRWRRTRRRPERAASGVSRRDLLFGWMRSDREMDSSAKASARTVLRLEVPKAPTPYPHGGEGCTACGACSRICPASALQWTRDGTDLSLLVDPFGCISCGECVRACPEDVLGMASDLAPAPSRYVALTSVVPVGCERCGRTLSAGESSQCAHCRSRREIVSGIWAQLD